MESGELRQQVREARGKFAAMAGSYSLGVFNDNFFRQAAILLAGVASKGNIMMLFALPYILLAPQAGWFADRFSKRHVVIGAKGMELAAMTLGAIGVWTLNWPLIMIMTFMMALQSCVFGPALNGSIPELYPAVYVNKANAILKAAVTICILSGVALSGIILDIEGGFQPWGIPTGRFLVGLFVLGIAGVGLAASFGTVHRPAASPNEPFPKKATWEIVSRLAEIWRDKLLFVIVLADVFIWSIGSLLALVIAAMEDKQFLYDKWTVSTLTAAELVGVAIGGGISSKLNITGKWHKILPLMACMMGLTLLAVGAVPMLQAGLRLPALYGLLGVAGIAGGLIMIPCESFVQIRPNPARKGAVIAAANFAIFSGILVSGFLADLLNPNFDPSFSVGIIGGFCVAVGVALHLGLRRFWK
ncbi:MAG: MFS transporter [Phycisphaerae bacterium]